LFNADRSGWFGLKFRTKATSNAPPMIDRRVLSPLLALTTMLAACNKPAVESYRVPKEVVAQNAPNPTNAPTNANAVAPTSSPSAAGSNAMANTAVPTAGGPGLTWTAPAQWTAKPASAMRKGSFTIKAAGVTGEADLSITAFPGDVGGELANVNRWRGQIQLPPLTEAELATSTEHIDHNGLHMTVVDLAGKGDNAQRTLGAIIPHAGATWFVKLMGPEAIVAREKAAFLKFLETVKPSAAQ
jgi:hypothetical protein